MKSRLILSAGPSGLLAFFLSALLAVQVAVAFLPVPAANDGETTGFSLVICSGDGTRTITLPEDGDEPDSSPVPHGHCPLCIVSADVAAGGFEPVEASRIVSTMRYGYATAPQTLGRLADRHDAIRAPPFV